MSPSPEMLGHDAAVIAGANLRMQIQAPNPLTSNTDQFATVHAEINGAGAVLEEEFSAASDPALAQTALDLVRKTQFPRAGMSQRQVYITIRFVSQTGSNQ